MRPRRTPFSLRKIFSGCDKINPGISNHKSTKTPLSGDVMVSQDLLEILRCPACVRETDGLLEYYKESWLICQDCGRKYPISDDIPVMLIDEGDKWTEVKAEDLPIPPPV
jgi:uncharacterized protein YbaR (Trm112 family)